MPNEAEAIGNTTSLAISPIGSSRDDVLRGNGMPPTPDDTTFVIEIDRDLAVQLVGSDAGRPRRTRPHGAMTKCSSEVELADVQAIMEPFLGDESRRVHVIAQVNAALGIPQDDGRTLERCRREAVTKAEVLDAAFAELKAHADSGEERASIAPLVDLQAAVRRCLSLNHRA